VYCVHRARRTSLLDEQKQLTAKLGNDVTSST
jgi:hypothetical protein